MFPLNTYCNISYIPHTYSLHRANICLGNERGGTVVWDSRDYTYMIDNSPRRLPGNLRLSNSQLPRTNRSLLQRFPGLRLVTCYLILHPAASRVSETPSSAPHPLLSFRICIFLFSNLRNLDCQPGVVIFMAQIVGIMLQYF